MSNETVLILIIGLVSMLVLLMFLRLKLYAKQKQLEAIYAQHVPSIVGRSAIAIQKIAKGCDGSFYLRHNGQRKRYVARSDETILVGSRLKIVSQNDQCCRVRSEVGYNKTPEIKLLDSKECSYYQPVVRSLKHLKSNKSDPKRPTNKEK